MLKTLTIRNFAIIDELDLQFYPGFNVFTGETGAGKSIILDAVSCTLGGKTDPFFVREGTDRAVVEAVFSLPENPAELSAVLDREDLRDDPAETEIVMTREIRAEGRSSARVNGHSVNLTLMKEIGQLLVDIHGQSDHLSLLNPASHIGLLDRFADNHEILKTYRTHYRELQKTRAELSELRGNQDDLLRKRELLAFQVDEIQSAHLQAGEEDKLRQERDRFGNAEKLNEIALKGIAQLEGRSADYPGILDLAGYLSQTVDSLTRIDPALDRLNGKVIEVVDQLNDLLAEIERYQETLEFNPARLEHIEDRLALFHTLKRKYGGSLEAVAAFGERAAAQLETLERSDERLEELEYQEAELLAKLSASAQDLSARRSQAALHISQLVEKELNELRMPSARFEISISSTEDERGLLDKEGARLAYHETGFDQVEFLIAPNPGEGLKPMAKIASGGETSRLMLALKNSLAAVDHVPTMIFDEIDQGIGGRVGSVVGQKLWQLSRNHQVFCITHLPQLAAYYDVHFHVSKTISDQRTRTQVENLSAERSLHEFAQLLGADSRENLLAAEAMIQDAQNSKKSLE